MARTRTVTETEELDGTEETFPEHPLFPLEEGEKTIDVTYILISRFEEGVQKYGPNVLASELMSESDIAQRWGGGHYIIIARAKSTTFDGQPGKFRKHRRIHLPGNSKPLSPDPTPQEQKMANPNEKTAPPVQQNFGDMGQLFAMMLQMNQQSSDRAAQQSQQFMTMFMTIMQGSKSDAQAMTQTMMTMSSQQQQSMMQFVTAIMGNRGGGPEEMAKYADLLRSLGVGGAAIKPEGEKPQSESIGAMLENAADFVQGLAVLKGSAPPPQQIAPDTQAAPTGGASSVLKAMMR
jgi:hypothetical protein